MKKWDLFLSHASDDKETVVEPLAQALAKLGLSIWYDSMAMSPGATLTASIDEGLAHSTFGVLVITPRFLAKRWPKYEADALLAREARGETMIQLLFHDVDYDDVKQWSPELADRLAILTRGRLPIAVAMDIARIARPDIFEQAHKRLAALLAEETSETQLVKLNELRAAPIQHQELPPEAIGRIRLVRAALLDAYPHSMDFWIDGFRHDAHPSKNISEWEHLAAVYREYVSSTPLMPEQYASVFNALVAIQSGLADKFAAEDLPTGAVAHLSRMYGFARPLVDMGDRFTVWSADVSAEEDSAETKAMFDSLDKERFPADLPDDLLEQFIDRQRVQSGDSDRSKK